MKGYHPSENVVPFSSESLENIHSRNFQYIFQLEIKDVPHSKMYLVAHLMASNLPCRYSLFVVYRSNLCSCGCGTKAKQQEWNAISFIERLIQPQTDRNDTGPQALHEETDTDLSNHYPESPPAVKVTRKRRERDLRLALLNPMNIIICSAQNGFSRDYSEFYYLCITLFLFSALLFKAAAAFIHHLCYWLNVSWPGGESSLVIIRHYGCILKAYSPIGSWSQEWWCHLQKHINFNRMFY